MLLLFLGCRLLFLVVVFLAAVVFGVIVVVGGSSSRDSTAAAEHISQLRRYVGDEQLLVVRALALLAVRSHRVPDGEEERVAALVRFGARTQIHKGEIPMGVAVYGNE